MPLWVATLAEAAPMVTVILVTDTSPILFKIEVGRMIGHLKIPLAMENTTVILHMTAAYLPEDTPPVEGMNMRVRRHLITSSNRQAGEKRTVPSTGTVHSLGIF